MLVTHYIKTYEEPTLDEEGNLKPRYLPDQLVGPRHLRLFPLRPELPLEPELELGLELGRDLGFDWGRSRTRAR